MSYIEKISIQIHPRAFSAFGEDLVTNDLVAITELVKNSYDAYAFKATIEFGIDEKGENYISVTDDGLGMSREIILKAWATIATPYKKKKPTTERIVDGIVKIRKVSGNKGLGRFSAARLGDEMIMYTKSSENTTLKAFFDWRSFDDIENISDCSMSLEQVEDDIFKESGTKIVIKKLKNTWDKEKIDELESELSRLITPFKEVSDFSLEIKSPENEEDVQIEPKSFIDHPVYKIEGEVTSNGTIKYTYSFDNGKKNRLSEKEIKWILENYKDINDLLSEKSLKPYTCGAFSFELRVWDLDADSIQDVAERFNIVKKDIRNSIRLYKGISVYRDNVLVLPKSETTRDWLGLDAKRISQIGRRLSTSQIIGIIYVSNENNPQIKDTTDREKLADTAEYKQFIEVIRNIVDALQQERQKDKVEEKNKESLSDIIAPLSASELLQDVEAAAKSGGNTEEIIEYVRDFHLKNEKQLKELNERLIYYAQTASLGSVAIVIMHEFLTGMTCIKRFLNKANSYLQHYDDRTKEYLLDAELSHKRIVEVTESFAPLYKKNLRKNNKGTNLLNSIQKSIRLIKAKKMSKNVQFQYEISDNIFVKINESELQTVFINLFDNACFWMKDTLEENKRVKINVDNVCEGKIVLSISDTGCGIEESDAEKIFIPGVTSKPKGIGMGLVIVTEIVKGNEGDVGVRIPGDESGATFILKLPIRED